MVYLYTHSSVSLFVCQYFTPLLTHNIVYILFYYWFCFRKHVTCDTDITFQDGQNNKDLSSNIHITMYCLCCVVKRCCSWHCMMTRVSANGFACYVSISCYPGRWGRKLDISSGYENCNDDFRPSSSSFPCTLFWVLHQHYFRLNLTNIKREIHEFIFLWYQQYFAY